VWNLQYSGTGTNAAFSNGTWSTVTPGAGGSTTNLPAYLIAAGFVWNNYSELWINVGTTTKTVSNYDFSNAPMISFNGTGAGNITFTNCKFAGTPVGNGNVYFPADINKNTSYSDLTPMTVTFNNCTFSVAKFFAGCGYTTFNSCRFTGQLQNLGDVGYNGTGLASLTYNQCYITGGGVQPPGAASHVELSQFVRNVAGCSLVITGNVIDISKDGQTTNASWGSSWTGVFSCNANGGSNGPTVTMTDNIFMGFAAVDANPANPNVTNCILAYGNGMTATLTNNVMEIARFGYVRNLDGAPVYEAADGGGNRSYANAALTTASSGWT
jgi:hypothetical protein